MVPMCQSLASHVTKMWLSPMLSCLILVKQSVPTTRDLMPSKVPWWADVQVGKITLVHEQHQNTCMICQERQEIHNVANKAKKSLDVCWGFGNRPVNNPLNFLGIQFDSACRNVMAKESNFSSEEKTLFFNGAVQAGYMQCFEHQCNISFMIFQGVRPNDNIVQVHMANLAD
jgi:hypothetical protein